MSGSASPPTKPAEEFPSTFQDGQRQMDKINDQLLGEQLILECVVKHSGEKHTISLHMGNDVAFAKGKMAEKLGVPYSKLKFFFDEKLMFDPLSFNDFENIDPLDMVQVRVEVEGL